MALALAEAGAKVYGVDLKDEPGEDFKAAARYALELGSRLKYVKGDVTDQPFMNKLAEDIANEEGRIDVSPFHFCFLQRHWRSQRPKKICIAAAGILMSGDCLNYPIEEFRKVSVFFLSLVHKGSFSL